MQQFLNVNTESAARFIGISSAIINGVIWSWKLNKNIGSHRNGEKNTVKSLI